MSLEVIARAIKLVEMDPNESMRKWFSSIGFTNTHYKNTPYDKVDKTDVHIFNSKHSPYVPKYSVVSVDMDKNEALAWEHKPGKYKKLPFNKIRLNHDTSLSTED